MRQQKQGDIKKSKNELIFKLLQTMSPFSREKQEYRRILELLRKLEGKEQKKVRFLDQVTSQAEMELLSLHSKVYNLKLKPKSTNKLDHTPRQKNSKNPQKSIKSQEEILVKEEKRREHVALHNNIAELQSSIFTTFNISNQQPKTFQQLPISQSVYRSESPSREKFPLVTQYTDGANGYLSKSIHAERKNTQKEKGKSHRRSVSSMTDPPRVPSEKVKRSSSSLSLPAHHKHPSYSRELQKQAHNLDVEILSHMLSSKLLPRQGKIK